MDGCLSGAVCLVLAVGTGVWLVDRALARTRLLVTTAAVVVAAGLICAGLGWSRRERTVAVAQQVAVQVQVAIDGHHHDHPSPSPPIRDTVPRPITDAELTTLVLDLRTRTFPTDQLVLLRAEAARYLFTPEQGARILMCFRWDGDRLGALEILRGRLLGTDHAPLLAQFGGPFGNDRDARLILGD